MLLCCWRAPNWRIWFWQSITGLGMQRIWSDCSWISPQQADSCLPTDFNPYYVLHQQIETGLLALQSSGSMNYCCSICNVSTHSVVHMAVLRWYGINFASILDSYEIPSCSTINQFLKVQQVNQLIVKAQLWVLISKQHSSADESLLSLWKDQPAVFWRQEKLHDITITTTTTTTNLG